MSCSCLSKNKHAKVKKGSVAYVNQQKRNLAKAPDKRVSQVHLKNAQKKRQTKGLSLANLLTLGGDERNNPMRTKQPTPKRGSIAITHRHVGRTTEMSSASSSNTTLQSNNTSNNSNKSKKVPTLMLSSGSNENYTKKNGNANQNSTGQDYDQYGHDVALHILHSRPSEVRQQLAKLGAADGLGSDEESDTESDMETDDDDVDDEEEEANARFKLQKTIKEMQEDI